MSCRSRTLALAIVVAGLLPGAFAQTAPSTQAGGDNQPAPLVLLVPVQVNNPALESGCWAQLYDDRDYKGEMLTVVGPMSLDALDKSTGRHLRRSIASIVTGPKANLVVYEHRMFKDRNVAFGPNSREAGVSRKIGPTGRVESLQLNCT